MSIIINTFGDFFAPWPAGPVEIVNPLRNNVVRTLTQVGDSCHIKCADGTELTVPINTAVIYEPWSDDRGSLLFERGGHKLKICTEFDMLRNPANGDTHLICSPAGRAS